MYYVWDIGYSVLNKGITVGEGNVIEWDKGYELN